MTTAMRSLRSMGVDANPDLRRRFWSKVDRVEGGCWEWRAGRNRARYGIFGVGGRAGAMLLAHRISYELFHGDLPAGQNVLHRCDNPPCVNPHHLFLGDRPTNSADMVAKGRSPRGDRNAATKLRAEDVRRIRALARSGVTQRGIAELFPIAQQTVSEIVTGKIWSWLP